MEVLVNLQRELKFAQFVFTGAWLIVKEDDSDTYLRVRCDYLVFIVSSSLASNYVRLQTFRAVLLTIAS